MDLEYVKNYLHVDYEDDDTYLETLLEVSEIYIDECVGEAYKTNEKLVKLKELLQLKLIQDLYDNRGYTIDKNSNQDIITTTILTQLSLVEGDTDE